MSAPDTLHSQVLDELVALVRDAPPSAPPQHALVLGRPGDGKSTLLRHLAARVAADATLAASWLPVPLDPSPFNVSDVTDLWLNVLRATARAHGDPALHARASALEQTWAGDALEEAARTAIGEVADAMGRRLLVLVDDLDEILERIGDDTRLAHLRGLLQHDRRALWVGTSARPVEAAFDYRRPLYDQLRVLELAPLDLDRTRAFLVARALRDGDTPLRLLASGDTRLRLLEPLLEGNPGVLARLYATWRSNRTDTSSGLGGLLAAREDVYRARVDRLGQQLQRVLDALAVRWEAATAEEIADALRLERAPVSAQLSRLMERGFVERVDIGQRAVGYQVRDRRLALWMMQRAPSRGGAPARWLGAWIDLLHEHPRWPDGEVVSGDAGPVAALWGIATATAQRARADAGAVLDALASDPHRAALTPLGDALRATDGPNPRHPPERRILAHAIRARVLGRTDPED